MKTTTYIGLIFAVVILIAGFMVLNANLNPPEGSFTPRMTSDPTITQSKQVDKVLIRGSQESALPYFILSAVFVILILVLPRLRELSISSNALVLKLLTEVKDEASKIDTTSFLEPHESLKTKSPDQRINGIKEKIELVEMILKNGKP
jgi:hypothetical protein